jgi:hypothetical protein
MRTTPPGGYPFFPHLLSVGIRTVIEPICIPAHRLSPEAAAPFFFLALLRTNLPLR